MALYEPEMEFYTNRDESFDLESPLDEVVLPYQEEDWEFGADPSAPYVDSDTGAQWEDLVPFTQQQLASFYHNSLLERSDLHTNQFLENSKDFNSDFKQLLITLKKATEVVTKLRKDCDDKGLLIQGLCQRIFDTEMAQIKAEGFCQDQRKVHTMQRYTLCKYNESVASELGTAILDCQHLAVEDTLLAMYTRTLTQLQCEQFIFDATTNVRYHTKNFKENTDSVKSSILVKLADESLDMVRQCINTMFYFIRKDDYDENNTFVVLLQNWIRELVCLLYELTRDGGYTNLVNEEAFIINHVIRSPPNTESWAKEIVQISEPENASNFWDQKSFLDHVIHSLFLILRAPKGRGEFLSASKSILSIKNQESLEDSGNWALIDENGEDLKGVGSQWHVLPEERDMVSLYRQVPFENALAQIFCVVREGNGGYCHKNEPVNSDKFLYIVASCDMMCDVLGEGLATLGAPKYKQLVRRIAQTIRNVVLLMAEYWEYFKENVEQKPQGHSLERLQTEFDEFVKRCVERLLSVARLGVYQFLADLPFKFVSQRAAEMLYVLMNVPAGSRAEVDQLAMTKYSRQEWLDFIEDSDTKLAFEERLSCMPENEVVYLLTTFCNLACARPDSEDHLINIIAMDIYMVSFVYSSTKDICSKMGRELLCTVASIHPFVMSTILDFVNRNSDEISSTAFFAVADMPFNQWLPKEQDIELLRNWILDRPLNSIPVRLVQTILKGMNWGTDEAGCLFLPHSLHCEIALLLVEVCHLYDMEKKQSGLLIKSIDQVSRVASAMRATLSVDENFHNWVWEVLLRLKLHRSQLNISEGSEPHDKPAPIRDSNEGTLLPRSNEEKLPQACYVTIMMTNVGYSMNMFLQLGLPLLRDLVESGNKVATVNCLAFIIPMFIRGNVSLAINSSFTNTFRLCLMSDAGMLSGIASRLVEQKLSVPRYMELLMGAISDSLVGYDDMSILMYWMELVLATAAWWDNENAKILLDFLLKCAFQISPECSFGCGEVLYSKYRGLVTHSQKNSTSPKHRSKSLLSSVLTLVGGGNSGGAPSFVRELSPNFLYLAYYLISAETRYENECKLWTTLLPLMKSNTPESALKKALSQIKLQNPPTLPQLALFRWARLVLITPSDHPLLPAICQKFFMRYIHIDPYVRESMGQKFFTPQPEAALLIKLKSKLMSMSNGQTPDGDFAAKLQNLYRTFTVWIEEEKLHDDHLYLPSLPSHYEPQLLASIRTQNQAVWSEYIDSNKIGDEIKHFTKSWTDFHTHKFKAFPSHSSSLSIHATRCQRVTQLLRQFESPLTLDPSLSSKINFPIVVDQLTSSSSETLVGDVEPDLKGVMTYAQAFAESKSKLDAFNRNYIELLPDLYSNEEQRKLVKIECQSAFSPTHRCAGPAQVQVRYPEKTLNDIVSENLKKNRASYRELIGFITNPDTAQDFSYSAIHLITIIHAMIKKMQLATTTHEAKESLLKSGAQLFYDLADLNSDERWKCPPTRHLLITCIDLLGQVFIYGQPDQAVPLLEQMLKRPETAALLSAHFSPAKSCCKIIDGSSLHNVFDTAVFVQMYERVVNAASGGNSSDILFVLITKFDLESWCVDFHPPKTELIQLLKAVTAGLVSHSDFSWPLSEQESEKTGLPHSKSTQLSNSAVQEVFLTHLSILVQHSADQVFFDSIRLLLQASKNGKIDPVAWDALNGAVFGSQQTGSKFPQDMLPYECVDMSVKQLAVFFADERKASASLYTAWQPYILPLSNLMNNLVLFELRFNEKMQKADGAKYITCYTSLVDRILPLFSAWLNPVLLEDKSRVLWPWKEDEQHLAMPILTIFKSILDLVCVETTIDVSQCVASLWTFYLTNCLIANGKTASSYICSSYQTVLSDLPWKKFIPNLTDLDRMVQLCATKLDCALHFLCHIFPEIDWHGIMAMCRTSGKDSETPQWSEHTSEVLSYFLHIAFVLASEEARLASYSNLQHLLTLVDDFPWHLMSYDQFDFLSNIIGDKYNAFSAIFDSEDQRLRSPRYAALRLLQIASGLPLLEKNSSKKSTILYGNLSTDTTWMKRQSFVRCIGNLIRKTARKQSRNEIQLLEAVTSNLVTKTMRSIGLIVQNDRTMDETKLSSLYSEIWRSMNAFPSNLQEITKKQILNSVNEEVFSSLAASPEGHSTVSVDLILTCIMASACNTISNPENLAVVTERCSELCLMLLSKSPAEETAEVDNDSPVEGSDPNHLFLWKTMCHTLGQVCKVSQNDLTDACLSKGCILAALVAAQNLCDDAKKSGNDASQPMHSSFASIVKWVSALTPKNENEPKVLLLLAYIFNVCDALENDARLSPEADINLSTIADSIATFLPVLEVWSTDKVKSGILGSLGIGRATSLSVGFRVALKVISVYAAQTVARLQPENEELPNIASQAMDSLRKLPLENRIYALEVHPLEELLELLESGGKEAEEPAASKDLVEKIFSLYYKKQTHFLSVL